jgi:hypothetical protein
MLIPLKKLEIFQELKSQKTKYINLYYSLMKKIELKPLSKANLALKVEYLVNSTAYDMKIKKRSLGRKVLWATSEMAKRKEEYKRMVLKLKGAKTVELKGILVGIIGARASSLGEAERSVGRFKGKLGELTRRISLLVHGELARKILEANERWLAQSDLMEGRIEEYYRKIAKQKKLLELNLWQLKDLQNPKIKKKYQNVASGAKTVNSTNDKLKKMKKTIKFQTAQIKMMEARAVDAEKLKKNFKLLKKEESRNMTAVIKQTYKFDIEQQITTRKRCMSNLKKLIKKDMKSDVNQQLRRMNAYTNSKDVKRMIHTGTVTIKRADSGISDPKKLLLAAKKSVNLKYKTKRILDRKAKAAAVKAKKNLAKSTGIFDKVKSVFSTARSAVKGAFRKLGTWVLWGHK